MNFKVVEDETQPQGGHAILKIEGAPARVTGDLQIRIQRLKDQQWLGPDVWQGAMTGRIVPAQNVSAGADGLRIRLGPDVVDRLAMGEGLSIELVDLGIGGRLRWPKIKTTAVEFGKGRMMEPRRTGSGTTDEQLLRKQIADQKALEERNRRLAAVSDAEPPSPPPPPPVEPVAAAPAEAPAASATPVEPEPTVTIAPQPRRARRWPWVALAAVLVLACGGVAGWYYWSIFAPAGGDTDVAKCGTACDRVNNAIDKFNRIAPKR